MNLVLLQAAAFGELIAGVSTAEHRREELGTEFYSCLEGNEGPRRRYLGGYGSCQAIVANLPHSL